MLVEARTHKGKVRRRNEDCYFIASNGAHLYVIADGMGGHAAGDIASTLAIKTVSSITGPPNEEAIIKVFDDANMAILKNAYGNHERLGMGTTLTMLWMDAEKAMLGHVGDSRAYLLRDGNLEQVTCDHSWVAEMRRNGFLTDEEAQVHPYKNVIMRSVGVQSAILPDIICRDRKYGDIWFLCSDGITDVLADDEIKEILLNNMPDGAAEKMFDMVLKRGAPDNLSVIIVTDTEERS